MKILIANVNIFFETPKDHNFFFGYYDISPLSKDGTKLLAQRVEFNDRMPMKDDELEIGYFDLKTKKWIPLTTTKAWNWQQGCRLQWLGPDFNRYIIYNDRKGDKFVSYIFDIVTHEKTELPKPIYSLTPDGRYAITLSFERLHHTRYGYGYEGVEDRNRDIKIPEDDGIYLLDIPKKKWYLIISIKQLYLLKHLPVMDYGYHWVNHLMFNPNGSRFAFVHRFNLPNGGIYTRVLTADRNGKNIFILLDSGNAGHFTWRNDKEILMDACEPGSLNKIRKSKGFLSWLTRLMLPLYRKVIATKLPKLRQRIVKHYYLLFKDLTNQYDRIGVDVFPSLGHPSFNPVFSDWFIADTYQDENNYRHLYMYNVSTGKFYHIASFYSPVEFNDSGYRCDLHPKWSYDGKKVMVDYVNESKKRGIMVINLNKIIDYFDTGS